MAYNQAITLPFSIGPNGVGKTTDISKIWKDRVYGVVLTSLNERVMSPQLKSRYTLGFQDGYRL